jgi:hypothetical protein
MERARVLLEVRAGMVPGTIEPEYTRQFHISTAEWEGSNLAELVAQRVGAAQGYTLLLALQGTINWVTMEWVYL